MTALPRTADPAQLPDPHQDQAQTDAPARTARLRSVLGKLIAHGKELAEVLNRRRPGMARLWIAVRFGTKDLALVLARITRGLQMAAALQASLPQTQEPPRPVRPARPTPAERKPRTRPESQPRNNADSVLATLPTSKEIAALLRHRPVGEVLTEICLDLGILTVETFWQQLESVLLENGADRDRIAQDAAQRIDRSDDILPPYMRFSSTPPPQPAASLATTTPAATGPP